MRLSASQAAILTLLLERTGNVVPRSVMARRLGYAAGAAGAAAGRGADMHLHHLRRRLARAGIDGIAIDTVHGQGYALRLTPQVRAPRGAVADSPPRLAAVG